MGLVLVQAEALHTGLSLAVKDASPGGLHVLLVSQIICNRSSVLGSF